MIPNLVLLVRLLTVGRVTLIRKSQLFLPWWFARLLACRQVFRPIDCFCCDSRSRFFATANSRLLATKTCISHPATSLLHSTYCWESNLRTAYQHSSSLLFGLALSSSVHICHENL